MGFRQDKATLQIVEQIFAKHNRPLLEVNIRQADVPENCTVLVNKNGTAPGMWFEHQGKIYVSMPGVPFEMMYLVQEEVIPRLQQRFNLPAIVHHTLLTAGVGESFLADLIADIEDSLPAHIKLAYLPKLGQVRLRLSGYGNSKELLEQQITIYSNQIMQRAAEYMIANVDEPLEKAILNKMAEKKLTLAVAESCTGGYISHLITQHPGCSSVFLGGAVSYANSLKQAMLSVNAQTLNDFGAVSEETVKEMALGVLNNYNSDYSIAVTGIAGPDGGSPDKPVGTVWIAVANHAKIVTNKFSFGTRRAQNIERSAINALVMLFQLLKENEI